VTGGDGQRSRDHDWPSTGIDDKQASWISDEDESTELRDRSDLERMIGLRDVASEQVHSALDIRPLFSFGASEDT